MQSAGAHRTPATEPAFEDLLDRVMLASLLDHLAPRQRKILQMRYIEELTQTEIATPIGTSQVHVGRLIAASLDQLNRYTTDGSDEARTPPAP